MNPNVWPIVEGTPAGVTIHYVDPGIDTGDVIAQREVPIEATDTGGSLYDRTLIEIVDLFKEVWPAIRTGTAPRTAQDARLATHHRAVDVDALDHLDLDTPTTTRDVLNRIRARTYADRTYAYFEEGGRRIYVSVTLSETRDR
jgi:methionyl-tRNA formyltransferase